MSPFDDDDFDPEKSKKTGLKINNDNSSVKKVIDNKAKFVEAAQGAYDKYERIKSEIFEYASKFKSFFNDKTLKENKGPISINIENETIDKLIKIATEINNDETQDEAGGATALLQLTMKCMLIQRDRINELSYEVHRLELLCKDLKNKL